MANRWDASGGVLYDADFRRLSKTTMSREEAEALGGMGQPRAGVPWDQRRRAHELQQDRNPGGAAVGRE